MSSSRAKLPGVGVLRSRLNYDDPRSERYKTFQEDCRLFIRRFTTTSGVPGTQLHDRWSQEHIDGMREMVDAFLNKNSSGNEYWPSERSHPNYNELVYRDHPNTYVLRKSRTSSGADRDADIRFPSITKRVRQLFFKINQQAISNMRYKSKHGVQSNIGRPDTEQAPSPAARPAPGSTIHDPIDLESEPYQFTASDGRFHLIIKHAPNDFRLSVGPLGDTVNVKTGAAAPPSQATGNTSRAPHTSTTRTEDVYTVPDDPKKSIGPHGRGCTCLWPKLREVKAERDQQSNTVKWKDVAPKSEKKRAYTEDTHLPSKKPRTSEPIRRRSEPQAEQQPQRKSTRVKLQRYQSLYFQEQSSSESSESNSEDDIGATASKIETAVPSVAAAPISSSQSTQPSGPSSSRERPKSGQSTSGVASMIQTTIASQKQTENEDEPLAIAMHNATTTPVSGPFAMAIAPGEVDEDSYTPIQQNQIPGAKAQSLSQGSQETLMVPEAPMDVGGAATAADSGGSVRSSPPPPELGTHEYAKAVYDQLPNTETSHAAAIDDAHYNERTQPTSVHSEPAPPHANAVDAPSQDEKKEHTETTSFPSQTKSSASMMQQTTATPHAVRLVVISKRPTVSRSVWTPTVPLQKKTFQQLKDEIPLQLSSDFLGFKFSFVGPEERTVWEVQDGNEYEFQHMKLDMYAAIEEWKEETQGSGAEMVFQLRIEELRSTMGKYKEADDA